MSCPTPFKVRFPSALKACNALIAIKKRMKESGELGGPVRFYECRCKGWHLTSKSIDDPCSGIIRVKSS